MLAFSFCQYFHSISKKTISKNSKIGMAKGVVDIFSATELPLVQF